MQNKLNIVKKVVKQFRKGMEIEKEHGPELGKAFDVTKNNKTITAKLVGAHIKEIPDYYDRIKKMEKDYDKNKK